MPNQSLSAPFAYSPLQPSGCIFAVSSALYPHFPFPTPLRGSRPHQASVGDQPQQAVTPGSNAGNPIRPRGAYDQMNVEQTPLSTAIARPVTSDAALRLDSG